jgi:hypothetical protein
MLPGGSAIRNGVILLPASTALIILLIDKPHSASATAGAKPNRPARNADNTFFAWANSK